MTDRVQAGGGFATVVAVVVVLAIVGLIGIAAVDAVTSPEAQAFRDNAESWCDEHGDFLYNVRSMSKHSGLHCQLNDGTLVHMSSASALNWTDNVTAIRLHFQSQPGMFANFGAVFVAALVWGVVLVGGGRAARWWRGR